ncbi:MAG: flagellar basal body P-ring formation protein FlgA [Verrucomicrobia bacterium]|nr:flagellar basal body P-ring formation protein FlgA [Verrucomicrobiota bacterium]
MNPRSYILFSVALALCALAAVVPSRAETTTGAAQVAPVAFTQETLITDLSRQISERFQLRGELQLDLARPFPMLAVAGPVEVSILTCPARLSPTLLLQVRLQKDGRVLGDYSINLKAQLFRDAWVSRMPIERGSNFDPAQLDTQRVDFLQQRDVVPADGAEGDLTYATSVSASRLLTWRDLTRRSLVRKGQIVEVSAIDGTLTITTKALAMENGAAGDMIKLRNLESKKDFSALVVADARAQVRF